MSQWVNQIGLGQMIRVIKMTIKQKQKNKINLLIYLTNFQFKCNSKWLKINSKQISLNKNRFFFLSIGRKMQCTCDEMFFVHSWKTVKRVKLHNLAIWVTKIRCREFLSIWNIFHLLAICGPKHEKASRKLLMLLAMNSSMKLINGYQLIR